MNANIDLVGMVGSVERELLGGRHHLQKGKPRGAHLLLDVYKIGNGHDDGGSSRVNAFTGWNRK